MCTLYQYCCEKIILKNEASELQRVESESIEK